jgi:hypothetical protein
VSPWFPAQGNGAVFALEILVLIGTPTITVSVSTKKADDDDVTEVAMTGLAVESTIGIKTWTSGAAADSVSAGFNDLVRFKFDIGNAANDGVHFRMLNPAWLGS